MRPTALRSWPHWSDRQRRQGVGRQHRFSALPQDDGREALCDHGIFVLRTNTDLNPLEAMLCYKQLWAVEQTFRTAKHLLTTRPIFHKLDETIRGHVFCSFLALVLKTELEERIAVLERVNSWPEIIADLDSLTETEIEYDGKHFIVRSAPRPAATLALRAAGVALPPTIRDAAVS
jgi:transposase